MNNPLFGLLFTTSEKPLVFLLLLDVAQKNKSGKALKEDYCINLQKLLDMSDLAYKNAYFKLKEFEKTAAENTIAGWPEDKKNLLKGLVIDMLCYNDKLSKSECLAAIAFFDAVGIEDQSLKNITKVLP